MSRVFLTMSRVFLIKECSRENKMPRCVDLNASYTQTNGSAETAVSS